MNQESSSVTNAWVRIRKWFEKNIPDSRRDQLEWGSPASATLLTDLSRAIHRRLPPAFIETYRVHDGIERCGLFEQRTTMATLMLVRQILEALEMKKYVLDAWEGYSKEELAETIHCDPAIKCKMWTKRWLPFSDSGSGDYLCIDFDPTKEGVVGQVIEVDHETGPTNVVAPSFEALVLSLADDLERGAYVYDDSAGQIKRIKHEF